jgi:hypothetical protein
MRTYGEERSRRTLTQKMQPSFVSARHTPGADGWEFEGDLKAKVMSRLNRLGHALVRHLPDNGYPSEHPWERHHDPARPRG